MKHLSKAILWGRFYQLTKQFRVGAVPLSVAALWFLALPAQSAQSDSPPAKGNPPTASSGLPDGPGKDTLLSTCGRCHSPLLVMSNGRTQQAWEDTIMKMVGYGAVGTDEQFTEILDYLTKNVPPGLKPVGKPVAAPAATGSPAGGGHADAEARGKAIFSEKCVVCHYADSAEVKLGPGLKGLSERGTFTSDGSKITDDALLHFIQTGKGAMPPFKGVLDSGKIQDIIVYLKAL